MEPCTITDTLEHTQLVELAKVFCRKLGHPTANDLTASGFSDLPSLVSRGWITRDLGRYSIGYQPGRQVVSEMWKQDSTLCSVLRLPPPEPQKNFAG